MPGHPAGPTALDLEQQVCFGLSVAARGVVAAYRPLLEPLGLTHPQYLVMVSLWQHGPMTVKALGTLLMLDSGTLSPMLKRLQTMGHVRRERAEPDERLVVISLTDRGETLRQEAMAVHDKLVELLGLSADELSHLQQVLGQVIVATSRAAAGQAVSTARAAASVGAARRPTATSY